MRFTRAQIKISVCPQYYPQCDGDYLIVPALTIGPVAYHRSLNTDEEPIPGWWTVSHLPTGHAFERTLTRKQARGLAAELASIVPDAGEWRDGAFINNLPKSLRKQVQAARAKWAVARP